MTKRTKRIAVLFTSSFRSANLHAATLIPMFSPHPPTPPPLPSHTETEEVGMGEKESQDYK